MKKSIELKNINKSFGKKQVLFDVSLSIPEGCIYGLLGPSGCGKTTSVKIIAGILNQDSGEAIILGKPMPDLDLMRQIGYMAQSDALYATLSAYENLKFFGQLYSIDNKTLKNRIQYVMELVNLTKDLMKPISAYSGGMKRRLSLAIALLANPKVLILDEPTVGIDPVLRNDIWKELYDLANSGVTILITTHVMDEATKCNLLAMMWDGKVLITGSPQEIQEQTGTNNIEESFIYLEKSGDKNEN